MNSVLGSSLIRREGALRWRARLHRRRVLLQRGVLVGLLLVTCPAAVIPQLVVERTIFFSATGTEAENCIALRDVLNSITGASSSTLFHVKVSGGVYDCGTTTLSIPSYVLVEGAGINRTFISGTRDDAFFGVVDFDRLVDAGLRSLSVGNGGSGIAVTALDAALVLENVALHGPTALRVFAHVSATGVRVSNSRLFSPTAAKTETSTSIEFHSTEIWGSFDTSDGGGVSCSGLCYNRSSIILDPFCLPPPPPS